MPRVDKDFNNRVCELVNEIPHGRVMTYGQIAALCGSAWAAWEVGQIAHLGPSYLPWHRVVNKHGGMGRGFVPGGPQAQRQLLETEGISFGESGEINNLAEFLWQPSRP